MKREAKKPRSRKQSASDRKASRGRSTTISGGANLKGRNIDIGGDVVGRDKLVAGDDIIQAGQYIERQNLINIPRSAQIAIGVAATALVLIAIAVITRPTQPVQNGMFESGLAGWDIEGTVQVVENDTDSSTVGKFAAQMHGGSAIEQTVNVPAEDTQLIVRYRSPSGDSRGTFIIYLNDEAAYQDTSPATSSSKQIDTEAPSWNLAVVDLSQYRDQSVKVRVGYTSASARTGGLLRIAARQGADVLWVARIEIIRPDSIKMTTIEPSATPPLTTTTPAAPTRVIPTGPLLLTVEEKSKACKDSTYYIIEYSLTATGGRPPYSYYRDIEAIGGPVNGGIVYPLTYGENTAATGTFIVIDSSNQRAEEKFYASPLDCP